jgi:KaiC/GvpD/RAD55 family RecA-like ATPase/5S rRNA maturation endonuclease (ribonuclease M5)
MVRFTRASRCPICGGADSDPRGHEKRCSGFLSDDGGWARCTREEHAGGADLDDKCSPPAWIHRLRGDCRCGVSHGPDDRKEPSRETAHYVYEDEASAPVLRVCVVGHGKEKKVWQEHPEGDAWIKGGASRRLLYRWPELLASEGPVYVVEGERDVETMRLRGFVATCNLGGAAEKGDGKWRHVEPQCVDFLRGRQVIVVADKDPPGRLHASQIAASLPGATVVECARGKDVTEHVALGGRIGFGEDGLVPVATPTNGHTNGHTNGAGFVAPAATVAALARTETSSHTPVSTLASVLARWRSTGALVRETTDLADLDTMTGGGPIYGSRWYILGAPDAWKTALIAQFAHTWALRGIAVGILAVDEEDEDLATRIFQRTAVPGSDAHFGRRQCEDREALTIDLMDQATAGLPIRMYDGTWSIEDAASDLHEYAQSLAAKAALFVDSIQAVQCNASRAVTRELSNYQRVTYNVSALRKVASKYRIMTMATGEMGRQAYRNIEAAESFNDMAAGKESGAIEYSARVMLALRNIKDEKDLLEMRVVKNKHGPSWPGEPPLYLRTDRATQSLTLTEAPEGVSNGQSASDITDSILLFITQNPGIPGADALAKRMGLRAATVRQSVAELVTQGHVDRRKETTPKGGQSVRLYLHTDPE